jgi:hypothetical protein
MVRHVKWLALALGIVAVILAVVGVIYFVVPAHSLPSALGAVPCPAKHPNCNTHRVRRGEAAIGLAVVFAVLAGISYVVAIRQQNQGTSMGRKLMGN